MKTSTLKMIVVIGIAVGIAGFAAAENRQPTKGYIPDEAFGAKSIKVELVPDYIVAYARNGDVAGYVRKTDYFVPAGQRSNRVEVVDETLSRTVGHMVRGRGFVPLGTPDDAIPEFESHPVPPEVVARMLAEKQSVK